MTDQTAKQRMTAALATRIYAQRDLLPSRVRDPHCAFTRADAEMLARAILGSDWLAAEGFGDVRQAGAEGEIRGQMKHITAEMVRGDQPLDEKEEYIADLRARLSHMEAERDDLVRQAVREALAEVEALADEAEMERAMYHHSGLREDLIPLAVVPACTALRAAIARAKEA